MAYVYHLVPYGIIHTPKVLIQIFKEVRLLDNTI